MTEQAQPDEPISGISQRYEAVKRFSVVRLRDRHMKQLMDVLGGAAIWSATLQAYRMPDESVEPKRSKRKELQFRVANTVSARSLGDLSNELPSGMLPHVEVTATVGGSNIMIRIGSPKGFYDGPSHSAELFARGEGSGPPVEFLVLARILQRRCDRSMYRVLSIYTLTALVAAIVANQVARFLEWANEDAQRAGHNSPVPGLLILLGILLAATLPVAWIGLRRLTSSGVILRRRFGLRRNWKELWADYRRLLRKWYWGSDVERNTSHAIAVWNTLGVWLALLLAAATLVAALAGK